jgi:hypothetical protein
MDVPPVHKCGLCGKVPVFGIVISAACKYIWHSFGVLTAVLMKISFILGLTLHVLVHVDWYLVAIISGELTATHFVVVQED